MTAHPDPDREDEATPVFVDPTGRRRRIVRRVALAACAGVLLYLAVFVAALFGAPIPTSALIPVPGFVPVEVPTTSVPPPIGEEPARPAGAPKPTARPDTGAAAAEPARPPSVATTAPPAATTTAAPTSEHRNSRAPTTPPGQSRTTPPGNGR